MDPKYLHDTRKKMNDLAISHNRLTTLSAYLLNEVQNLRRELNELKGIKTVNGLPEPPQQHHQQHPQQHSQQQRNMQQGGRQMQQGGGRQQQSQFKYDPNNFINVQADEILKQLQIGHD